MFIFESPFKNWLLLDVHNLQNLSFTEFDGDLLRILNFKQILY